MAGVANATLSPPQGSEGQTETELRMGIESRAEALRRIQVLLDAAILQMNSYLMATVVSPSTDDSTKVSATDSQNNTAIAPSVPEEPAATG